MYIETEGIILKRKKINNLDCYLTMFSKKLGKIQVFAKGANNPKRAINIGSHPFVCGNYSLSGNKSLVMTNVEIISNFYNFREDLKRLSYGSYFLDFVDKSLGENENNNELYVILLNSLHYLSSTESLEEKIKIYFEIHALKALGYSPIVNRCVVCNEKEEFTHFSVVNGGVVCKKCYNENGVKVHKAVIKLIEYILMTDIESYLKKEINDLLVDELDIIINSYIDYHLSVGNIKSKKFLKMYE